jgi:hypothetical protein
MTDNRKILERVLEEATGFLDGLADRQVAARTDVDGVAAALRRPLPEEGAQPLEVIEELIAGAAVRLAASPFRLMIKVGSGLTRWQTPSRRPAATH